MDAGTRPDPSRCPLCGESNRCALEIERETGQAQPPCWCMAADFSEALLARVPAATPSCSACTRVMC